MGIFAFTEWCNSDNDWPFSNIVRPNGLEFWWLIGE